MNPVIITLMVDIYDKNALINLINNIHNYLINLNESRKSKLSALIPKRVSSETIALELTPDNVSLTYNLLEPTRFIHKEDIKDFLLSAQIDFEKKAVLLLYVLERVRRTIR